jgi:hypothetical protein
MPIRKCASQNCFKRNVAKLIKEGKKQSQALAIAYSVKREAIKNKRNKK